MTDGANILDFVGKIEEAPGLPNQYDGDFSVTSGCTEESGVLQMNFGTTPPQLVREANRAGIATQNQSAADLTDEGLGRASTRQLNGGNRPDNIPNVEGTELCLINAAGSTGRCNTLLIC